jgi:hypothetical protein
MNFAIFFPKRLDVEALMYSVVSRISDTSEGLGSLTRVNLGPVSEHTRVEVDNLSDCQRYKLL